MSYINQNPLLSRALLNPTMRIVSFGGGIQSWAMLVAADQGLLGPKPDFAIIGDTDDESDAVWQYYETHRDRVTTDILVVRRGSIIDHIRRSKSEHDGKQIATLPYYLAAGGQMMRTCTDTFKIAAVTQKIRELLGVPKGKRVPKDTLVEVWVGFSMDEKKRAGGYPAELWQEVRYPLLELGWTRGQCEQFLMDAGFPVPARSRCIICPYRSDESWRSLSADEFAHAVRIDESLREGGIPPRGYESLPYLHRERKPLRYVDFTPPSFGLPFGDNEEEDCFGGCGT